MSRGAIATARSIERARLKEAYLDHPFTGSEGFANYIKRLADGALLQPETAPRIQGDMGAAYDHFGPWDGSDDHDFPFPPLHLRNVFGTTYMDIEQDLMVVCDARGGNRRSAIIPWPDDLYAFNALKYGDSIHPGPKAGRRQPFGGRERFEALIEEADQQINRYGISPYIIYQAYSIVPIFRTIVVKHLL